MGIEQLESPDRDPGRSRPSYRLRSGACQLLLLTSF